MKPAASGFDDRKSRILAQLASLGPDASPKGSVDLQIQPLIDRLNEHNDVVTTSSCSGRISVFLEGSRAQQSNDGAKGPNDSAVDTQLKDIIAPTIAGAGGKGGGGRWLFLSHEPIKLDGMAHADLCNLLFGGERLTDGSDGEHIQSFPGARFVHFKFEAMILHISTRELQCARKILSAALAAGFRESGIMNPGLGRDLSCMLAVRSNGLMMDSVVGVLDESTGRIRKLVDHQYLRVLVDISNQRFVENSQKIDTFFRQVDRALFLAEARDEREDKEIRRVRKREEGLKRQRELAEFSSSKTSAEIHTIAAEDGIV